MSKFNPPKESKKVKNYEGADAYRLSSEAELYTIACTSLLQDKFYESESEEMERIEELVSECDPEFVAKLAIYAREEMHLRSLPVLLTAELARLRAPIVRKTVYRVIQRADELTEILACWGKINGKLKPIPNALKKGIAQAFLKFDEYQFAKYDREGSIRIRDVMFLTHPKPTKGKEGLFKKIANANLPTPYTWEVELSKGEDKKKTWEELIESHKLGYMALLRNLRNILNAGVSQKHITQVCKVLSDPERIRKSKQFPFRFFSAYKEIEQNPSFETQQVLNALEKAVETSIENVPEMEGKIVIACDVSGSMEAPVSRRSSVERYDIGLLLGQLLSLRSKQNIVGFFGSIWKIKRFTSRYPLQNTMRLHECEGEVGYATNGYLVIKWLLETHTFVDKVMIFTDCQMWNSVGDGNVFHTFWAQYKRDINPQAELYLFDIAGYGKTPIDVVSGDVYLIAGWSEKVFQAIKALKEKNNIVDFINRLKI